MKKEQIISAEVIVPITYWDKIQDFILRMRDMDYDEEIRNALAKLDEN